MDLATAVARYFDSVAEKDEEKAKEMRREADEMLESIERRVEE